MDRDLSRDTFGSGPSRLLVTFTAVDRNSEARVRVRLASVILAGNDRRHAIDWRGRVLEFGQEPEKPAQLVTEAPVGSFDMFVLQRAEVWLKGSAKQEWQRIAQDASIELHARFETNPQEGTRLRIVVNVAGLRRSRKLADAFSLKLDPPARTVHRVQGHGREVARLADAGLFSAAAVAIPLGVLRPGTDVVLDRPDNDSLPAIFRGQRRVGPPIRIQATDVPDGALDVTVPYLESEVRKGVMAPRELVVLQLNDERTLYRELRPHAVDTAARTLTVSVTGLSTFFACTPGIELQYPKFSRDAYGTLVHYAPSQRITVSGRVLEADAQIELAGGTFDHVWASEGYFVFTGVAVERSDTILMLRATAGALVEHTCELNVRRIGPTKRVPADAAHRLCGPRAAYGNAGTPFLTAVLVESGRATDQDLQPELESWQRSLTRNRPYLFWFEADSGWQRRLLLDDTFVENQMAAFAIREIGGISVDSQIPERVRFLQSLQNHLYVRSLFPGLPPNDYGTYYRATIAPRLAEAARQLGPVNLSMSSLPLVVFSEDEVGVAFVAPTLSGYDAAHASSLRASLVAAHSNLGSSTNPQSDIAAGTLLFVRTSRTETRAPEAVSGNVWCVSLTMRLNPSTSQPAILGLEAVADSGGAERATLVLFQRQLNGSWGREVVWADQPIVHADFAFAADGTPRVVVSLTGVNALNPRLFNLERANNAWAASPIIWDANEPFLSDLDVGLWPRLEIDDRNRPVIAFAYLLYVHLLWIAAVREPTGWRAVRLGASIEAGGGSVSLAQFAPSLAMSRPGIVQCAFGYGVLHLAEINLKTLTFVDRPVDVDRNTGFYPAVATRPGGSPAVVYKDYYGQGPGGRDEGGLLRRDDVHFFEGAQGNFVPRALELPLASGHSFGRFTVADFGAHVPLTCSSIVTPDLPSLLMTNALRIRFYPRDRGNPGLPLAIAESHPLLESYVRSSSMRPEITEFTIVNNFQDEDIREISITLFGRLFNLDDSHRDALTRGSLPDEVRSAFAANGISLSEKIDVDPVGDDKNPEEWVIQDASALTTRGITIRQVYRVRRAERNGQHELHVYLPPAITVRADGETRDAAGRIVTCCSVVCRRTEDYDTLITLLGDRLDAATPELGDLPPGTDMVLVNAGLSHAPRDPDEIDQGGIRFTLTISGMYAEGSNPDYTALLKTPWLFHMDLKPEVRSGRLQWRFRTIGSEPGELDVNVGFGPFTWLKAILAAVPGLPILALGADAQLDQVFTALANEGGQGPGVGGLPGLIRQLFEDHVNSNFRGSRPPDVDAVFLRNRTFDYWTRILSDRLPLTILTVLPLELTFGASMIGGPSVSRNFLITNDGELPVWLQDVRLGLPGADFHLISPVTWPKVLPPGTLEVITIAFTAQAPEGFHRNYLEVRYNGNIPLRRGLFSLDIVHQPELDALMVTEAVRRRFEGHRIFLPAQPPITVEQAGVQWVIEAMPWERYTIVHEGAQLQVYTDFRMFGLAEAPAAPAIEVAPTELTYGLVQVGQTVTRRVTISSIGAAALNVSALRFESDTLNAFTVAPAGPATLPPGSFRLLDVNLTGRVAGADHRATFVVESNDPNVPRIRIPLHGLGVAPSGIQVSATSIAAGDWQVGFELPPDIPPTVGTRPLNISNQGAVTVTITGSSFLLRDPQTNAASPHFQLLDNAGNVAPQQEQLFPAGTVQNYHVRFRPLSVGNHAAVMNIQFSDPAAVPLQVSITGRGV